VHTLTRAVFWTGRLLGFWLTQLGRTDEMMAESLCVPFQSKRDSCDVQPNTAGPVQDWCAPGPADPHGEDLLPNGLVLEDDMNLPE
jgi:hypothetical protein